MRRRSPHNGGQQLPLIVPESSWRRIAELPDLRGVPRLALDRETKDDGLANGRGPGWAYGISRVVGCSVAWDGGAFYAPIGHPDSDNFDADAWVRWERDHQRAGVRFIFHNAPYDMGCSQAEWGLGAPELIDDTTAMSVMVDENRLSYRLDDVASWRGVPGKDEALLREAAAAYGYYGRDEVKANMWRMPAHLVGPYGEADAVSTLAVYDSLLPVLHEEDTYDAYRLECDLIPMVIEMRRRGIRIDLDAAEQAKSDLLTLRDKTLRDLSEKLELSGAGLSVDDLNSARRLAKLFDAQKVAYPLTKKSEEPSFTSDWMEDHPHWLPQGVVAARQAHSAATKFIEEYIQGFAHRGRIHATINQFRGENGGTRSHRFSYSEPPLQQIPGDKRPELRDMIRRLFLPEPGQMWCKGDFSQQEIRLIVHFAYLIGAAKADVARDRYLNDPATDYHNLTAELTGLERRDAKAVTFAKAYGAGIAKFALMNGCSAEEAVERVGTFDRNMPFVKQLTERCDAYAQRRGYIRLLDGARCHWDTWEACRRSDNLNEWGVYIPPKRRQDALEYWAGKRIRRAETRKAMNRLIQGSAARQVKLAMLACWRERIVPTLQVHDELDASVTSLTEGNKMSELMRDAVTLEVPMLVDMKFGPNWAEAKQEWMES